MKIQFDDSLRTGIREVDDQHEILVGIYNDLDEALKKGKAHRQMNEILAKLYQYTKMHFEEEEKLLEEAGYPDLAQHQYEHARLVEKLRGFVLRYTRCKERISVEVVQFTRAWVLGHIMTSDMAYVDHVMQNRGSARQTVSAGAPTDEA